MIVIIPLQAGTTLSNVRYKFLVSGAYGAEQSSGITQPSTDFPEFRFDVTIPVGAEEMVAYDVTDLANWNPAGLLKLLEEQAEQLKIGTFSGRTVTFRSVFESVVRRLGYNPRKQGDPNENVSFNVLEHINERVRYAWSIWDWPDLHVVEWRAFRTIWTDSLQFSTGDELYYFGDSVPTSNPSNVDPPEPGANAGYYTCIATAPIGTLPTNATYFAPLDLLDRYIAYQQIGQNTIGDMLDVFPENPRNRRGMTRILKSAPSSRGIDVQGGHDIVWILYRIPASQFTLMPLLPGATVDQAYYDFDSGNCYFGHTNPSVDLLIPFPYFLAGFVRAGAYADTIRELPSSDTATRMQTALAADAEALTYLQSEIDNLAVQGQRMYYSHFPSLHKRRRAGAHVAPGAIPVETFGGFS